MVKIPGLFLFLVSIVPVLKAQTGSDQLTNNTFDDQVSHLYESYTHILGKSSQIFNGPEYIPADINIKGHPFFEQKTLQSGVVKYDGMFYENIKMGFDIYRNEVAIVHYDDKEFFSLIRLSNQKINGFGFNGHRFVRLIKAENTGLPATGFYEILHDGYLKVLAKRIKKVQPSTERPYRYEFYSDSKLYIFKDGIFYPIGSRKMLFNLLEDEKKAIRRVRKRKKEDFENYVLRVCNYYEELKQERD